MNNSEQGLSKYWALFLVGVNISLILIVTLFPYTFIARDHLTLVGLLGLLKYSVYSPVDIDDIISNILLFIPLGLGLARIFQQRFSDKQLTLITSLIISLSLSLTVETLQIFLPKRTPSVFDLLTNILGGVLGAVLFYLWKSYFSTRLSEFRYLATRLLTKSRLAFITLSYGALVFCLMFSLARTNNFSNWDLTFPLLVGNERTGDRPWNGIISQVYFANRSLSATEINQVFTREQFRDSTAPWITAYQLAGNEDYLDQNRLSPDLEWMGYPPQDENQGMISVTQQHWLLTQEPVTKLIEAIRETSQFSLLTTVATRDTHQTGPARIISLSADPLKRNLTIGQQGSRLVVRIRTRLTGVGGSSPELAFPGIFADTNPHQLLFNFDQKKLQLFIDETEKIYTLNLSPEILFFHFLPAIGIRNFQVTPMNQWILKLAFYGIVLSFPVTFLLFMIKKYHNPSKDRRAKKISI